MVLQLSRRTLTLQTVTFAEVLRAALTSASASKRSFAAQAGELVSLDVPRQTPVVTEAEIAAVTRGDAAFGLDLLRVAAGDENLMISPYSIATALSMLYPGARGQTADEIAAVLRLEVPDETLHAVRNAIETALTAEPPSIPDDDREPFTIRPANSASSPKVPLLRPQRGSVARSAMGCSARLIPIARYSCRAISPN